MEHDDQNQPHRVIHPAKFTNVILDVIGKHVPEGSLVLDPFAGTGRIHEIDHITAVGVDIEDWGFRRRRAVQADALALPFRDETFDAIATSPTYGNRLADHHNARDGSRRHSYRHNLGRALHPNNSGVLQWGEPYREFHQSAWGEATRVLRGGGLFVLNVSDHVRGKKIVPVADWHLETLKSLGLVLQHQERVETPRMRHGANHEARVGGEVVAVLVRP